MARSGPIILRRLMAVVWLSASVTVLVTTSSSELTASRTLAGAGLVLASVAVAYEFYLNQLQIYLEADSAEAGATGSAEASRENSASAPWNLLRAAFIVPGGPFTILGLLGTFLGLVITLSTFDFNRVADPSADMEIRAARWNELASGAGLALFTSIIGIVLFIIFKVRHQGLLQRHSPSLKQEIQPRSQFDRICADLERLTERFSKTLTQMEQGETQLREACEYMVHTCRSLNLAENIEKLHFTINSLNDRLDEFTRSAGKISTLSNKIHKHHNMLLDMNAEIESSGEHFKDQINASKRIVDSARGEIKALSDAVQKAQEAVSSIVRTAESQEGFERLAGSLATIAEAIESGLDHGGNRDEQNAGGAH